MPGIRNAVGVSVWATDDRSGALIQGDAACAGTVHGVRGGDFPWVSGRPSTDATCKGNGW